jgi:hypothetical protein
VQFLIPFYFGKLLERPTNLYCRPVFYPPRKGECEGGVGDEFDSYDHCAPVPECIVFIHEKNDNHGSQLSISNSNSNQTSMLSMRSSTTGSDTMSLHAPKHPVAQLQGPFEESMAEAINETVDRTKPDPIARRTMLLEGPVYERVCAGRWKQKPGERFHPLWKISAQMSFGIHLLAEGLAKSEDDVMIILQTHVDDVDGFLESTTEDFDLAQSDIAERLRYLKLPLEHVEVFDRMLEDHTFRVSIVEGNKKIEHIMTRTSEATKDALKDVQKGLQATDTLGKYLEKVSLSWRTRSPELDAVFVAMVGNVEGWHRAFEDLYHQGARLGASLVQLASIVSEMQRRASIASRKTPVCWHIVMALSDFANIL